MRGKASGSEDASRRTAAPASKAADRAADSAADWAELSLEETGGFAGLRRGATLHRDALPPAAAKRVTAALAALASRPTARAPAYPDAQTLQLRVRGADGSWSAAFDTAELPKEIAALLKLAPLGPLPLD
jgi:hypothetical protein